MISELDLNIYQALYQQKKLTEKYVGKVEFDWVYSEVYYMAECTVGVPFDLFDKTIVGILLVDEVLSIEAIGDILGMNIIHKPENQQYRDDAEFDILRLALDNLYEYDMIEIGDTSYSACRLTEIGKEYAQKGSKFKIESNKPFVLVYDHTSQNHIEAKSLLKNLKGKGMSCLINEFDFLDEILMKQMASKQANDVFDEQKGNSFANPEIIKDGRSQSFTLKIYASLLYDLDNDNIRIFAYEPITKNIIEYFSEWLNQNKLEEIIEQYQNDNRIDNNFPVLPQMYIDSIVQAQKDFEKELPINQINALGIAQKANQGLSCIDIDYFWSNPGLFISKEAKESWFFLSKYNNFILKKIEELVASQNRVFIVSQRTDDTGLTEKLHKLFERSKALEANFFLIETESLDDFLFITDGLVFNLQEFLIGNHYRVTCLQNNKYMLDIDSINRTKVRFAETYIPIYVNLLTRKFNELIQKDILSKEAIIEFKLIEDKTFIFADLKEDEGVLQKIYGFFQQIKEFTVLLKGKHLSQLQSQLQAIVLDFEQQEISKLDALQVLKVKLQSIELELFDDYNTLQEEVIKLKNQMSAEENRIKDEILAKTYIIDTNVFIEEPEIITKIEDKHYIALTLTVIEELDKLKMREKTKDKASRAIKNINEALLQSNKQKKPRVKKAKANLSLLPEELQQKSGDNYLLSMAMVYQNENPTILTIDKNLQSKAMMIEIPTISLKEFLGEKPNTNVNSSNSNKIDYKSIFTQMQPNKNGKYQINSFIELLKKQDSGFDYKALGFKKNYDFIESLGIFEITENQFLNLKQ